MKGLAASLPALSKHDEKQAVRQGLPWLGVRDASVKFDGVQRYNPTDPTDEFEGPLPGNQHMDLFHRHFAELPQR